MSTVARTIAYHCDNDCRMQGCPSHLMTVEYQSTADIYSVDDGDGRSFRLDRNRMQAMLRCMKSIAVSHIEVKRDLEVAE